MIYFGVLFLIISYLLIPRRPIVGWAISAIGNALYLYPMSKLHRLDLIITPVVFTVISVWNVWLEHSKKSTK